MWGQNKAKSRNTYNPALRTDHPSFTLPPASTPIKTTLEKHTYHNVTIEKSPSQTQLDDYSYRVKMSFPKHPIPPPAIWKQAPKDSLTYKASQKTLIDANTIKHLLKQDTDNLTTWTPNIKLLQNRTPPSFILAPFAPDVAFAPDEVYQFWEPRNEQDTFHKTYYTYYANDTL